MDIINFAYDNYSSDVIEANILALSDSLIKLILPINIDLSDEILTSGFKVLNEYDNSDQSGDYYLHYNYIYDRNNNEIILTNNKDCVLNNRIVKMDIDIFKKMKNEYLSNICNDMIIGGVDVEIDGNIEHFSYKDEDQINIKELFDISNITQVPMYYHSDGNSCKLYTVEQIAQIYINNATNKFHHTTYINQLKRYVNELENIEEIESVEYGDDLTGEYLDTYNLAMNQFKLMIESMIGGKLNEGENN